MMEEPLSGVAAQRAAAVDVAFGLVFAALAAFGLLWLIPRTMSVEASGNDVAPAFIPRLSATVVLILSLAIVMHRLIRAQPSGYANALWLLVETVFLLVAAVVIMIVLPRIGFLATAMAVIVAGGFLARHTPFWAACSKRLCASPCCSIPPISLLSSTAPSPCVFWHSRFWCSGGPS